MEKNPKKDNISKTAQAEIRQVSSFPADVHEAILIQKVNRK